MVEDIPEEVKAQIEAQKAQCIFCKIVSGEVASQKIYEDEHIIGVLDINPATKGHALFLPKEHYPIMPLVPPPVFTHLFSKIPQLSQVMQQSLIMTGIDIFIANGGAAGQQSPHFLIHLIPRDNADNLDYGLNETKTIDESKRSEAIKLFAHNLPLMMRNHMSRLPVPWHTGVGTRPAYLENTSSIIYEDEKVLVTTPEHPQSIGQTTIKSKESADNISELSGPSSAHLFYTASYAATAAFEGLRAQGTNIILRSGNAHDRKQPLLQIDILDRYAEDGLNVHWSPMTDKPDLGNLQSQLSDALFPVAHTPPKPDDVHSSDHVPSEMPVDVSDPLYEIRQAIAELHKQSR